MLGLKVAQAEEGEALAVCVAERDGDCEGDALGVAETGTQSEPPPLKEGLADTQPPKRSQLCEHVPVLAPCTV